jgi:hypothetical protein
MTFQLPIELIFHPKTPHSFVRKFLQTNAPPEGKATVKEAVEWMTHVASFPPPPDFDDVVQFVYIIIQSVAMHAIVSVKFKIDERKWFFKRYAWIRKCLLEEYPYALAGDALCDKNNKNYLGFDDETMAKQIHNYILFWRDHDEDTDVGP